MTNLSQNVFKKGLCFAFNESAWKWLNSCKYKQQCSVCLGPHPMFRCFKRMSGPQQTVSTHFKKAVTPVILENMAPWLDIYPNQVKAELIRKHFESGIFVPKFSGTGCMWVENLSSVNMNKEIVRSKIEKEVVAGRVAGPFVQPPFEDFRISPLGFIPKKAASEFRLIHHLSFPEDYSLNDELNRELCSVSYSSFDEAVSLLNGFGRNCLVSKADIKSAFRLLPVCPEGFNSLGFQFEGGYYFDKCSPMGFSLSCSYFESFSSFVHWVTMFSVNSGALLHYLDDFLFIQ